MSIVSQFPAVYGHNLLANSYPVSPTPSVNPTAQYIETRSHYFAGIFNPYIGTISILFRPHMWGVHKKKCHFFKSPLDKF